MSDVCFKRSAIHNLRITRAGPCESALSEGIVLPRTLMRYAGIEAFEQVVVANLAGTAPGNRVLSFVVPGDDDAVEARGALARFARSGDQVCLITRGYLDDTGRAEFAAGRLALVDVAFPSSGNMDNDLAVASLELEYADRRAPAAVVPAEVGAARDRHVRRVTVSHLLTGIVVDETRADCARGSAELPASVLAAAEIERYRSVVVFNADAGGDAETYVVPVEEGAILTTGAMARFAPRGAQVSLAAFVVGSTGLPRILRVERRAAGHRAERVSVPGGGP